MNVLFFCHDDFACNSMGHIAGFAAGLTRLGHACAVAIPGDDRSSAAVLGDQPGFVPAVFSDAWERPNALFPDGQPADILHAWTPREHVRRAVEFARQHVPTMRLVVHLEDNEEHLLAAFAQQDFARLRELPNDELATLLPGHLAHPREYQRFLASAAGVTGIIASLADFVPSTVPFLELWPGVDFRLFHSGPADSGLRESLGIAPDEKVIVYPGSSHFANAEEMAQLYHGVFRLNARGISCRLIRTGHDTPEFLARFLPTPLARHILHLGYVTRDRVADLMRLADLLVQPGRKDAFNHYRLPSKLPEFLASGRPVLLPPANVGLRLRADEDAVVLTTGEAAEITGQCERVFRDESFAGRLAANAAAFARKSFDPDVNARALAEFYTQNNSI